MNGFKKLLLAAICVQTSACFWVTTKHEGETLRKDIVRIDKVQSDQGESMGSTVEKLKETLEEASKLLARNSADLGAQFDGLEQENARLTGLVMEAKRLTDNVYTDAQRFDKRIDELESRLAELEGKIVTPTASQSPDALYDEGMRAFSANDYNKARQIFRKLVIKFPNHGKADDAQYRRGESYYVQQDYKSAVKEYQAVFEKFGSSTLADDALFRAGEASEKLKQCIDARAYFGLLRQRYPKSDKVKAAKKKDATLKKRLKSSKYCKD